MADFAFLIFVYFYLLWMLAFSALQVISLWILASSALQVISLSWMLKRLKETMSTIEAVLLDAEERQTNSEALGIWLKKLEDVLLNASDLLDEIECEVQLRSQGRAGRKFCRFFSSSNPLVFCFRIGHRIKKMIERVDKILAERDIILVFKPKSQGRAGRKMLTEICRPEMMGRPAEMDVSRGICRMRSRRRHHRAIFQPSLNKIREIVLEIVARIVKLNDNVTYSFFRASEVIGLDDDHGKQIVYVVACIVGVCVDPFFLYIPFLSHAKMCLGMNRELWKVAVALRTVADFFTALILLPQLSRCMSSIKLILLMCVKYLVLAPIPQILFSEKFILKTLGGYTFWNLILFCHYGVRLVLIFQSCEQLKRRVSVRTLVRFNAPVYIFLNFIVSHVIGASWYYLSIKRQLSCWNYDCNIITGCIFHCDGTTPSTLNSTLYNQFCPINPPNVAVFDYGIYLDALQSRIVEEEGVLKKFLRSFFWGLRNLSSFASNLQTSTNGGETFFAIIMSAVALILLIYIIGNIQRYTELESARSERIVDKMKLIKPKIKLLVKSHNLSKFTEKLIVEHIQKALENGNKSFNFERLHINRFLNDDTNIESLFKDLHILETSVLNPKLDIQGKAEKWLSDNNIPSDQNNILFYLTCRLEDDEDVNLKSVLSVLPCKPEWMTKKDLCFDTLKKVPGLKKIDEEWFRSMSSKLKPVIYPKESYIFREGEPLDFIIFITNGIAWSYTTSTNAGGRVSVSRLEKGKIFGEELLHWKLDRYKERSELKLGTDENTGKYKLDRIPLSTIPISTANVKSHTQVEALVLMTDDLDLCSDFPVATSKFRRIIRKRMIVNAFIRKRTADSPTEGVDSSSRTEEGASVRREIVEV